MVSLAVAERHAQPAALAAGFLALFILERALPLRRPKAGLRQRLAANLGLSALTFVASALVVTVATLKVSAWTVEHRFGLLHLVPMPTGVQIAVGFLLMDAAYYYWHRVNHEAGLLWRFHAVHHLDPDLDVTTSFRFHVGEILYSTVFSVVRVGLVGAAPLVVAVYQTAFQWATVFHHSDLRLPIRVERLLNWVLVTPRMHGVHHSVIREETNSNYSVVFRWWDWLHRTLRLNVPQRAIRIGIDGYEEPQDNSLWRLLLFPLWRRAESPSDVPRRRPRGELSSAGPHVLSE